MDAGLQPLADDASGWRSRGQDHHDVEVLLMQIEPHGRQAAAAMRRLIDLKDEAHYGFFRPFAREVLAR